MSSNKVLKNETTPVLEVLWNVYSLSSSKNASCLRQIDAVRRTSIDTYFSTPKAGTMLEICTKRFGPKAKIDEVFKTVGFYWASFKLTISTGRRIRLQIIKLSIFRQT